MFKALFALGLLFAVPLVAAEELRILSVDEPPSSFINSEGVADGFAVDVVKAIQARLGNETPITFMPEIRVLKTAENTPNVLLFGFSKTKERAEKYHMITLLLRKSWVMYGLDSFPRQLSSLDDARKVSSIGVVRGDVRSIYLDQLGFTNTEKVPYHELNVKLLMNNRIDLMFYEPLGMAYACQKLGISPDQFKAVLKPASSDVYLMMSKSGTDSQLVTQWQQAAEALKQEGEFQRIAEKWSALVYQQTGVQSEVTAEALNF